MRLGHKINFYYLSNNHFPLFLGPAHKISVCSGTGTHIKTVFVCIQQDFICVIKFACQTTRVVKPKEGDRSEHLKKSILFAPQGNDFL